MRLIDADALIAGLEYDVEQDSRALDCMNLVGSDRERVQFDKDCKQNTVDLLKCAPTIELQQQWIPCSERLPEKTNPYLVTVSNWNIPQQVDHFSTYSGWNEYGDRVLAWMPLPAPYREGET